MKPITNKDIIVAAPEQYRDLARKLSHEMAMKTGLDVSYWTIKQYETHEFELGSARCVILLGNPDENNLTKDYLPIIGDKLKNRAGACFGYDGSKAVVFGEGKLDQFEEFQKLVQELKKHSLTTSVLVIFSSITGVLYFTALVYAAWKLLSNKAKQEKLRRSQTEVAIALFLTNDFDQMAGINKKD